MERRDPKFGPIRVIYLSRIGFGHLPVFSGRYGLHAGISGRSIGALNDLIYIVIGLSLWDPEGDSVEEARRSALSFLLRRMALRFCPMAVRFCPIALLNNVGVCRAFLVKRQSF